MICAAAGMSTAGLVPFASSFAMFAAGRAFEQVRNSIGYPHLNVKIGATHGGISVGEDGASHQCCEDFALMRSIPGMVVICPADGVEAEAAVKFGVEKDSNKVEVTLRSGGKTFITILFDSCYVWVIVVPVAFCLSRFTSMPIVPLFFCCQFIEIGKCIIGAIMIKSGIWIQKIVT